MLIPKAKWIALAGTSINFPKSNIKGNENYYPVGIYNKKLELFTIIEFKELIRSNAHISNFLRKI